METKKKLEDIASRSLGDSTSYAVFTDKFDKTLLNPMPRNLGREDWGIGTDFEGVDIWTCHESSFLTSKGLPVAGTLKFGYSSSSEMMVESKSMKLYLNSFDMCKMGDTIQTAIDNYQNQVRQDLEELLGVTVDVTFHRDGVRSHNITFEYIDLLSLTENVEELEFSDYKAEKNHLKFIKSDDSSTISFIAVGTNLLRSRCRHTKQKDVGSAYIKISTKGGDISCESILRQIISLREQNEFHELLSEKLYTDIIGVEGVVDCMVMLLYSRRGSLDINPVRASRRDWLPLDLINTAVLTEKTQGQ